MFYLTITLSCGFSFWTEYKCYFMSYGHWFTKYWLFAWSDFYFLFQITSMRIYLFLSAWTRYQLIPRGLHGIHNMSPDCLKEKKNHHHSYVSKIINLKILFFSALYGVWIFLSSSKAETNSWFLNRKTLIVKFECHYHISYLESVICGKKKISDLLKPL